MKKSYLIAIAFLLFISAVTGWISSKSQTSQGAAQQDNWDTLLNTQKTTFNYLELAKDLKGSGLLPISAKKRAELAEGNANPVLQAQGIPAFPEIKSVFSTDGTLNALLRLSDNSLVAAQAGDTIEEGWTLVSINLTNITAVFDEEEKQFPVVAYTNKKTDTDTQ